MKRLNSSCAPMFPWENLACLGRSAVMTQRLNHKINLISSSRRFFFCRPTTPLMQKEELVTGKGSNNRRDHNIDATKQKRNGTLNFVFIEGEAATGKSTICELLKGMGYTVQFEKFVELCKEVRTPIPLIMLCSALLCSHTTIEWTLQPAGQRGVHQVGKLDVHCHGEVYSAPRGSRKHTPHIIIIIPIQGQCGLF